MVTDAGRASGQPAVEAVRATAVHAPGTSISSGVSGAPRGGMSVGKPTVRTPSGQRLAQWFTEQLDALDRATEECSTSGRDYIRGQVKVLERVRDHVMREVPYAEVEAIAIVASGSTLAAADQWLSDATKGGAIDIEAA